MIAATDRLEFAPPPVPGFLRAFTLAMLAHLVLLAALTWGVHWTSESLPVTAEAELWSAVPQQAAPKLVEPPPEPKPPVIEPIKPKPQPPPPAPPAPPKVEPQTPDPAIALEQEKLRLKLEQDKAREIERQRELEKQRLEKQRLEKLKQEKKKADLEKQKKAEAEKLRQDALKAKADEKQLEAQRKDNLARMAGLAGASGSANSTGTAKQASGPSANYASRIRAKVKPNIVFVEAVSGNPTAEVEVRTSPDGTILSSKLLKASGVASWDEAVLKALDKTEVLPRDTDGRVPSSLIMSFRPKD